MLIKATPLYASLLSFLMIGLCFETQSSLRVEDFHIIGELDEFYEFPVEDARLVQAPQVQEEKVTLLSNDGEEVSLSVPVARVSETLRLFIEDHYKNPILIMPHMNGATIRKVVAILKRLSLLPKKECDEMKLFKLPFKDVLKKGALIQALHYLQIPMIVVIVEDHVEVVIPLLMALESPQLLPLIKEDELDKPILIQTQKPHTAKPLISGKENAPKQGEFKQLAEGAAQNPSQVSTTKMEVSTFVPSYTDLECLLEALYGIDT